MMHEIPIFPTLIYGVDVPKEVNTKLIDVISGVKFNNTGNHPETTDPDIHLRSELKFYTDYLNEQFKILKDKNGWYCDKLTLTSMWATKTKKGVCNYRHHHPMHWFSFIHYLTEGSATYFYDKEKECPPMMLGSGGGAEICFKPGANIPVGSMLLFPSYIPHSVESHDGDYDRYTIAGNIFPEGKVEPMGDGVSLNIRLIQ
mgnify:FL=1|tara:strand:- start:56 stop:658 length:603 start_codon:yes stop_codon:yes gene_type:complete